jgi:hypothetical protein
MGTRERHVLVFVLLSALCAGTPATLEAQYRDSGESRPSRKSHLPTAERDLQSAFVLPANEDASRNIRVLLRTDKPYLRPGDEIGLTVQADRDCYVTVFSAGASGRVVVLWPNRWSGWDNSVLANRPVKITGGEEGLRIKTDGTNPVERIVAYATTEKESIPHHEKFQEMAEGTVKGFTGHQRELSVWLQRNFRSLPHRVNWGTAELAIPVSLQARNATHTNLEVEVIGQETGMWCWAASAEMIMKFHGKEVKQSVQANNEFGRDDCDKIRRCPNPVKKHPCVKGGTPEFEKYGFKSFFIPAPELGWEQVKEQIVKKRPFIFRWAWTGGGAHLMVATGFAEVNGKRYVRMIDPLPPCQGEDQFITYEHFLNSPGKHMWGGFFFAPEPQAISNLDQFMERNPNSQFHVLKHPTLALVAVVATEGSGVKVIRDTAANFFRIETNAVSSILFIRMDAEQEFHFEESKKHRWDSFSLDSAQTNVVGHCAECPEKSSWVADANYKDILLGEPRKEQVLPQPGDYRSWNLSF